MRTAIVYKSATGFTKRYAEYIASETGADLYSYDEKRKVLGKGYDILVYGSSIIASSISGVKWYDSVKDRFSHSFLFATGASPLEGNKDIELFLDKERKAGHDIYYMPGGLNYEKMGHIQYFVMKKLFLAMVAKEQGKDSLMYRTVSSSYSFYDEKYAASLIEAIRKAGR